MYVRAPSCIVQIIAQIIPTPNACDYKDNVFKNTDIDGVRTWKVLWWPAWIPVEECQLLQTAVDAVDAVPDWLPPWMVIALPDDHVARSRSSSEESDDEETVPVSPSGRTSRWNKIRWQ